MDVKFLDGFRRARILVAGEIGLDEYLWGDTQRISPEAPVPVVEVESRSQKLGLAANVAQNIVSLGAEAILVSVRGEDENGDEVVRLLTEAGIHSQTLIADSSRPTPRKVRVLARKQHVVRIDYERTHPLNAEVAKKFRDALCARLPDCDGVVLQDYGKGLWNSDVMAFLAEAKRLGKPVFVDPSRSSPLSLYRGTTLMTPNVLEALALCGRSHDAFRLTGKEDAELASLAKHLLDETEEEHVVITCGPHGMVSLSRGDTTIRRIPTFARDVYDVTGAGDTVIAALALMCVGGQPLAKGMEVANAAAGVVVGRVGTACVTQDELVKALERAAQAGLLQA